MLSDAVIKAAIEKLVKKMISKKEITFTDDDIDEILEDLGIEDIDEEREAVLKRLNYITLAEDDIWTYLLLPKIEIDMPDALAHFIRVLYDRVSEGDLSEEQFSKIVAAAIFDAYASDLDFGDPLAWYLLELARSYKVEPDEVDDRFDYRHSYVGPIYYRYGKTWIMESYFYANYTRQGTYVGIQKGCEYAFEKPPKD